MKNCTGSGQLSQIPLSSAIFSPLGVIDDAANQDHNDNCVWHANSGRTWTRSRPSPRDLSHCFRVRNANLFKFRVQVRCISYFPFLFPVLSVPSLSRARVLSFILHFLNPQDTMLSFKSSSIAFFALSVCVSGAPLVKRIAQDTPASTALWEKACDAAGGGLQCNPLSVAAFATLLAAAGPCAQQDAADNMIDFAKSLNNDPTMIKLTQIFVQQPRNTPSSESVQYCQQAPKNNELQGLFQCQFQGANPTTFVGGIAVGGFGTIPLGHSTPLSPPGSCSAHFAGPIADGTQLVDLTQNPGAPTTSPSSGTKPASKTAPSAPSAPSKEAPPASGSSASNNAGGFQLQNGKDAQALNAKFAALTASSACTEGEDACVGTGFAQCVDKKFVVTSCGATLTCAALPLVNKAGTSITCTTESDAEARIAATGATGGITGA